MSKFKANRDKVTFIGILVLAAVLSIWGIWNEGYGNEFYAAAVKSMLTNWKNFFFVSLDPGGWVTVDKPPVSLWVQAAFAKVLGFSGFSIILPQSVATVATVAITGHVVNRHFGKAAGLISALVLALSPIFIVISRTNNTDSILIFFMTLSVWALVKAADSGKLRFLLLSMILLGVAYNAKTLEAFLILPALLLAYFFTVRHKWSVRIGHALLALVVLAAVSLSWSVVVDLTPASERPYVDNSTNNSELELAIGYNGLQRIFGQSGKNGSAGNGAPSTQNGQGGFSASSGQKFSNAQDSQVGQGDAEGGFSPQNDSRGVFGNGGFSSSGDAVGRSFGGFGNNGAGNGGGMGGMFNGGGSASPLRMFNTTLGGQDSWLLPFGLLAIAAMLLAMRKAAGANGERRRLLLRNVLLWGVSLVTMVGYFSVAGFFHPYYISVMCPALAALVGIGVVEMWKLYRREGPFAYLLPAVLGMTLAAQIVMLVSYPTYGRVIIPIACVVTGAPAALLIVAKCLKKERMGRLSMRLCTGIAVTGLLIAPAVWTVSSVVSKSYNAQIPSAGPTATGGSVGGREGQGFQNRGNFAGMAGFGEQTNFGGGFGSQGGGTNSETEKQLIQFLLANNTGEKFLIAVPSASEAEPIILETGKPVMAIGGFSGSDSTLTVEKLKQMVKAGEVKYFMAGGRGGSSSSELTAWVEQNGTKVDSSEYGGESQSVSGSFGGTGTIFDLSSYKDK